MFHAWESTGEGLLAGRRLRRRQSAFPAGLTGRVKGER